jgi:hypothetical protein
MPAVGAPGRLSIHGLSATPDGGSLRKNTTSSKARLSAIWPRKAKKALRFPRAGSSNAANLYRKLPVREQAGVRCGKSDCSHFVQLGDRIEARAAVADSGVASGLILVGAAPIAAMMSDGRRRDRRLV